MKSFLFILLLSFIRICQAQIPALIDVKYYGNVDIYDKPTGKIIKQMKNDSLKEEYLVLVILKQTKTHYYVLITPSVKPDTTYGWIKKEKYIGTFTKESVDLLDLKLYKRKSISERDEVVYKKWKSDLLTIEKYDGDWVYVSTIQKGIKLEGWIRKEQLCANPYSTCS